MDPKLAEEPGMQLPQKTLTPGSMMGQQRGLSMLPQTSDIVKRRHRAITMTMGILGTAAFFHFVQTFLFLSVRSEVSATSPQKNIFNWPGLQPSRELEWQKCYGGKLDCARLDVRHDSIPKSNQDLY